jgi:hypothetical protein
LAVDFETGREELACCACVAYGCVLGDTEHRGKVQRIGTASESFLELPVHTELGCCGADGAELGVEPVGARWIEVVTAPFGEQQMGIARPVPTGLTMLEVVDEQLMSEVVETAGVAADGETPVGEVDVIEQNLCLRGARRGGRRCAAVRPRSRPSRR